MTTQQRKYSIFKIILIGDVGTGKTSLLTQLIHRVPQRLPKQTTSLSVFTMRISKPSVVVQVWDSPGDSKYYYQTMGSIQKFNAALLFVDVTNYYTFERARLIADQIAIYYNSGIGLQIHLVQSKIQVVQKDPLKRKVSKKMLRNLADKFNGGVFQYRQNQSVQNIIQDVIEWKQKGKQIVAIQKQKQSIQDFPLDKQPKFVVEAIQPACQCKIF